MTFDELKSIIQTKGGSKGSDGKELYKLFGITKLAKSFDVVQLDKLATRMIQDCKVWIENWETIQSGVKVELEEIRKKELEDTINDLKGRLSPEELKALAEKLAA